jgi:hypothetical protein
MVYQGIPLVNLTGCEICSVLFGLDDRVEEWNLTTEYELNKFKISKYLNDLKKIYPILVPKYIRFDSL